jgi:quercetin dioxygenase-like cupin family protein
LHDEQTPLAGTRALDQRFQSSELSLTLEHAVVVFALHGDILRHGREKISGLPRRERRPVGSTIALVRTRPRGGTQMAESVVTPTQKRMATVQLSQLELMEFVSEGDPSVRGVFDFPVHSGTGAASTSIVYVELPPGASGPRHTDSAEEIALVLEGTLEVVVDRERVLLSSGGIVLIPAQALHAFHNVGRTTARAVGFFSSAAVVHVFDETLRPFGARAFVSPPLPEN